MKDTLEKILKATSAKATGADRWQGHCPAHEDDKSSLSITDTGGKILLHCHAGCTLDDVCDGLDIHPKDLFLDNRKAETVQTKRSGKIVASYDYNDAEGKLIFQVVRFEPKDFRQRRPDGKGGWTWNLNGVERVLYRLPELLRADSSTPVYLVEGEKDVDRLRGIGLVATTNPGGAGKWRAEYSKTLQGRKVVIVPDSDDPGRKHTEQVAGSLQNVGAEVKVLQLPGLREKGDVSDWLEEHKALELHLRAMECPVWQPPVKQQDPVEAWLQSDSADPREILPALAALPPIEYDQVRSAVIGKSDIRASTLDAEVSRLRPAPESDDDKQGGAVVFEKIEPWGAGVDGAELLDEAATIYRRYIILPDGGAQLLGLWTVHVYCYDAFGVTPFLNITSPDKGCGKTSLLSIIEALVPRPLSAANATPAVLYRAIEKFHPTLLVDEADSFLKQNEELRGILNAGHSRKDGGVLRTVGDDFEPRRFKVWCPKVISLIGRLPGTLEDRSIVVRLHRKRQSDKVEMIRADRLDFSDWKRKAARWSQDHFETLRDVDPTIPGGLFNRAADNWRPLLAVAEAAGGEWPEKAAQAVRLLAGESEECLAVQLLKDIREVFGGFPDGKVTTGELIARLKALQESPWGEYGRTGKGLTPHSLSRLLRGFEVQSRNIRLGETIYKGYDLGDFGYAFERYLPPSPSATPLQVNVDRPFDSFQNATSTPNVADRKSQIVNEIKGCSDVADRNRGEPETASILDYLE